MKRSLRQDAEHRNPKVDLAWFLFSSGVCWHLPDQSAIIKKTSVFPHDSWLSVSGIFCCRSRDYMMSSPHPPESAGSLRLLLCVLRRQAQLLAFQHFGDIKVEEVTVEDSLDQTGHDGDQVKEAFKVETPDPVEEIEGPIHAQAEQVVGGDRLRLASLADHEQLRQDCHRLQVDGERPQDLQESEVVVDENSKTPDRNDQELHSETVMVAIVGGPELHIDQVDGGVRTADVDHLHACVIEGDEGGEQIQVARGEHYSKQDLALSRDTCT